MENQDDSSKNVGNFPSHQFNNFTPFHVLLVFPFKMFLCFFVPALVFHFLLISSFSLHFISLSLSF